MYQINVNFEVAQEPRVRKVKYEFGGDSKYEIYWHNDYGFDFRYPFRGVIDKIVEELTQVYEEVELKIEPYEEFEDFIFFSLILNDFVVDGYYEHSLSCLAFAHEEKIIVERIRLIANKVQYTSNRGL